MHLSDSRQINHCKVKDEGGVYAQVDTLRRYPLVAARQAVRLANNLLPNLGEIEELLPWEMEELPGWPCHGGAGEGGEVTATVIAPKGNLADGRL